MPTYEPTTAIYIGRVPFNANYKHIRWFESLTAQTAYFSGVMDRTKSFTDYTYQRLQSTVDVPMNAEELYTYNYVMYKNANFGNKWFYAFITNITYVNAKTTRLTLQLDFVQTFMFDFAMKPCMVEREHVNDDTIGKHIKEEGLDTGELKCTYFSFDNEDILPYIVVASAVEPLKDGTYVNVAGDRYMGVISGTSLSVFITVSDFKAYMNALADNGQQDAVAKVYLVPRAAVPNIVAKTNGWGYWVDSAAETPSYKFTLRLGYSSVDGYVPRNNKCFCYPYNVFELTNFTGTNQQLRMEFFSTPGNVDIERTGGCDTNSRLMYIPQNYNGITRYTEGMVALDTFPTCSWVYQTYANAYGQSEVPNPLGNGTVNTMSELPYLMQLSSGAADVVSQAASLNPLGMISSAGNTVNDMLGTYFNLARQSRTPNTVRGGTNSTTALVNIGSYTAGFRRYQCRAEIIEQIDDYFSQYGYNVSVIKTPNFTGRQSWNYVKTNGANMQGNVPANYLAAFNALLDGGVTFWHVNDVGNYSLSNNIV